jgi:hypothetical protein
MNEDMITDHDFRNEQEVHLEPSLTDSNSTRNRNDGSIADPLDPRR